ncbi:inner membrane peptidase. Serine peptidase. MEROPS family S49 [Ectothiorhodospira mobilis]|uniref:Inner membrane peptidase. Serine peptidase. MEROPS family S49 n=1 Tax=Ectothiorhodospira mobilis TaxID=195064 RepID=A0A1I4PGL7_ECTMO|nr:protease SohB [Ectothiorhodospira mobilis]SFM26868.1 inner membrane peptidase. Serine peptidase. MEROPS family S49 [Ectothiorhodospira mobilis]
MDAIQGYLLFLAKAVTVVVAALFLAAGLAGAAGGGRGAGQERLVVRRVNDRHRDFERTLRRRMTSPGGWRERLRALRAPGAARPRRPAGGDRPRIFVLRFHGDLRATQVESLREEVTAVLTQARRHLDRVVLLLESGGGMIPHYGLAAAQIQRLREADLHITVTVDRIAASGGYLMAAAGHRIVAAPFAVVGSIGVVAQLPNLHRWLKRRDVDMEVLTAGEYKRTLTLLGRNTPEGRAKLQEELEQAHRLFKDFLARNRPGLDLERVGTGEYWYGEQAVTLGLVDELATSDGLLCHLAAEHDLYEVTWQRRQPLGRRLGGAIGRILERIGAG